MNVTVLLAFLLTDVRHTQHELIERLAREAYESPLHSIRQIYRVNYRYDAAKSDAPSVLPSVTLQGEKGARWPIENSMLIVATSESSLWIVLENFLERVVDAGKLFLVISLNRRPAPNRSEMLAEKIGRMLVRRGVINFCVISPTFAPTTGSVVSISKYDVTVNRSVSYDPGVSFEELFPPFVRSLEGHSLRVLFSDYFPYAYKHGSSWEGYDVFLMSLVHRRFRCRMNRLTLNIDRNNALDRMETVQTLLEKGTVDMHLPRVYHTRKNTGIGLVPAYEWESMVLVVPKSDELNLGNIMLQPFSVEVWTLVCGYMLTKQLFKLLSFMRRHCRRRRATFSTHRWSTSFGNVTGIGVELVSFLLIEAYLAKITEFLLYCRFKQDPQTLEEFFRSDILVLIPEYMDALVTTFEPPEIAERLRSRMVRPAEFSRMPASCCARIHTRERAEYIIRTQKYWDENVGRRQLYILPGSLKTIPMSYLLGRNVPFKNSFELFILHVYESGMMTQYMNSQRQFVALLERNFVSKGWLTLADLFPLFLLVACGWCLSFLMFGTEMLSITVSHCMRRNGVDSIKN